jgi:hypothetical protein
MSKRHNLMMMRTRNLGVVGTKGAGVRAFTKGPWYSAGVVTRSSRKPKAQPKASWNVFAKSCD